MKKLSICYFRILKWLTSILGIAFLGGGLYYRASQSSQKLEISKISPKMNGHKDWSLDVNSLQTNTVPSALEG